MLVINVLLVEAYANASFAPDANAGATEESGKVPAAIRDGAPIIDTSGGKARSLAMPPRTIALTFDDGPDPTWTPRVLEVLRRHQVHATFFLIGSQVARHPGLARQLVADGHEIGAHSFTHPRLAGLPEWRRDMEYAQTQMAIAYATGVATSLLRPPYSSGPDALGDVEWSVVRDAGRNGYL